MTSFRTDRNNNPTAFTVDLAREAGLILGLDYEVGDLFTLPSKLATARILGDPIAVTIKLINMVGYYTKIGLPRWNYIALPDFIWNKLIFDDKKKIIAFHYKREGGVELVNLFD